MTELVQEGFTFTEGPVGTADGGLFFSDIRANRTHYLDPAGKISVVREPTNAANGLALTKDAWARARVEPQNAEQLAILKSVLARHGGLMQSSEGSAQE